MISHKRIESAELHPTNAQLFGSIATKAADIGTYLTNAEHVEVEHVRNRVVEVVPIRLIIATPMCRIMACACV